MWTAIAKQWDYVALALLLGLYVAAAFAVAIIWILTLPAIP
jgi:hypothetical protein